MYASYAISRKCDLSSFLLFPTEVEEMFLARLFSINVFFLFLRYWLQKTSTSPSPIPNICGKESCILKDVISKSMLAYWEQDTFSIRKILSLPVTCYFFGSSSELLFCLWSSCCWMMTEPCILPKNFNTWYIIYHLEFICSKVTVILYFNIMWNHSFFASYEVLPTPFSISRM